MSKVFQPIIEDGGHTLRFKSNKIIDYLFETGKINLNELSCLDFPSEDYEQLMMLLGYSVDGFISLSRVRDTTKLEVIALCNNENKGKEPRDVIIEELERYIKELKLGMRDTIANLYGIHPDDLDCS